MELDTAKLLACTVGAFAAGWYLRGARSSASGAAKSLPRSEAAAAAGGADADAGSGEDDSGSDDGSEALKMVLVIRTDLGMKKGKICAQCCHAAVGAVQGSDPRSIARWERCGTAKIALKVKTQEEMLLIESTATANGINSYIVRDAGRTQIPAGSLTVCALGPAPISAIDAITGRQGIYPLKLM
jgi:PTH2 family peptidyl-tRNA hydrolase